MKSNATSIDFPLYSQYGNKVPPKQLLTSIPKLRISCVHEYNNETPDFFRLDSMIRSTRRYNNPFLNEVISVDRNESLKSLEKIKSQIYFIDKLKTSRNLSQNTVLLKTIQNENSKLIKRNRNANKALPPSIVELPCTDDKFKEKLKTLHHLYSPKLNYKMKRKADLSKNVAITDRYKCSLYDKEYLEKLQTAFDPRKSGYLRNLHDYDIKENMGVTDSSRFHFERVEETIYNPITDRKIVIKSPVIMNEKWNKINET